MNVDSTSIVRFQKIHFIIILRGWVVNISMVDSGLGMTDDRGLGQMSIKRAKWVYKCWGRRLA